MSLKTIVSNLMQVSTENKSFQTALKTIKKDGKQALDVGCGFGRNLEFLKSQGFEAVGVDINVDLVRSAKQRGFEAYTLDEFSGNVSLPKSYDVLVMSHIIEHFSPEALKSFMEHYLEYLKPGGYLLIQTPLLSQTFFDDFDHVKPYQPSGLGMVFSKDLRQVQYQSKVALQLVDLHFRRIPFKIYYARSLYISSPNKFPRLINLGLAVLFILSFGAIGKVDGWLGLYQKV